MRREKDKKRRERISEVNKEYCREKEEEWECDEGRWEVTYLIGEGNDSQAIPLAIITQPAPARSLDSDGLVVELLHKLVI